MKAGYRPGKFFAVCRGNNSGIILIVVLWILVILTMLALGLGNRTRVETALARHGVSQVKARAAAWAAVNYARDQIAQDSRDSETKAFDLLGQCGFRLPEGKTVDEMFQDVPLQDTVFNIFYTLPDDGDEPLRYGLGDEESRINVNGLTVYNYKVLSNLLTDLGCPEETAETVAAAVIDWKDEDDEMFQPPFGAEQDDYQTSGNGIPCQNRPFGAREELLYVKGMTPEIYRRISPYVTVVPRTGPLQVNIDTASPTVLRAFARSYTGAQSNTTLTDADSLVEKIMDFRQGPDRKDATADDRKVDINELPLNAKEKLILLLILKNRTEVSRFLRFHVRAVDREGSAAVHVEVTVDRDDLSLVTWKRF